MLCELPDWVVRVTGQTPTNQLSAIDSGLETLSVAAIDVKLTTRHLGIDSASRNGACESRVAAAATLSRPSMTLIYNASSQSTRTFGPSIGTGYWENIPDAGSVACTAILLMQVPNDYWDSQHGNTITYLLLIKEVEGVQCDAEIERVGIERTVDLLEGRAFDNTWLENTQ